VKSTTTILDLSLLPAASRREVIDFYHFLLSRSKKSVKQATDAAQEHDRWFRGQVEAAVKEADDPAAEFVLHEKINSDWTDKKKTLKARTEKGKQS